MAVMASAVVITEPERTRSFTMVVRGLSTVAEATAVKTASLGWAVAVIVPP